MHYVFPRLPGRATLFKSGFNGKLSLKPPAALEKAVRDFARENGLSVNQGATELLISALTCTPFGADK